MNVLFSPSGNDIAHVPCRRYCIIHVLSGSIDQENFGLVQNSTWARPFSKEERFTDAVPRGVKQSPTIMIVVFWLPDPKIIIQVLPEKRPYEKGRLEG